MGYTTALGHTPQFSISKGGEDITSKLADRIISIRVESRDGGGEADVVDILVDDRDWNITLPSLGEGSATLSVSMGFAETGLSPMGTFQVDEITLEWVPKQLRLHGNSLGMTTNAKAPVITSYAGQTLGDIVGAIAQSAGVSPVISSALSVITVPYLNQSSSSMHLLQELERRYNGLAKFSDGKLSFTERGTGESASGQSIETFTLSPEDFGPGGNAIRLTNASAYSNVQAMWFDSTTQTTQSVTSGVAGSPNSSVPFLIKRVHPSQIEAQSAADSTMAQLNRRTKEGTLILSKGAPAIRGGQGFSIAGCRAGIDDQYMIRRAVHAFTKDAGIVTTLDIYCEGGAADLSQESTDGTLDYSGIPASTIPTTGIGHN